MKRFIGCFLLLFLTIELQAQVNFESRFEVESDYFDPLFEIVRRDEGIVSFRTLIKKAFSSNRVFQYFLTDKDLNTQGIIELPVKDGFDMIGYDLDRNFLYVLFQKGTTLGSDKYILKINLDNQQGFEYALNNLLSMELAEFLVQGNSVIVMGAADSRPAVQVYDLENKSTQTVQGIYGNNTHILQIRKMPEIEAFEVIISRKGQYREREISINTYDLTGNLLREIKIDEFGEPDQEIMDALMLPMQNYRQTVVGSFGLERRDAYQGMFLMDINEFGEYDTKLYTLEDFPNFYNYLTDKPKERREKEVLKEVERDKVPSIRNVYAIREAFQGPDGYYVYFDHFNIVNNRGGYRSPYSPTSMYRYDRIDRLNSAQSISDAVYNSGRYGMPQTFAYQTEYSYISAHFVKIGPEGQVVWDNSATYDGLNTDVRVPFGDVAVVGEEFYHAYMRNDKIRLAYFKKGEKIFDNLEVPIELPKENERIAENNMETLSIVHWYDRYFLLSGTQRIRYQKEDGSGAVREVFFLSKVLVAGDLYDPEQSPN
ncbi:hypothetical protein [Algoriphagus sp. PAP.12]|uniref:hypothetical protein n=1 Tax=Algoriphagus sp. PAP.12 TaxID=2996678 RepID=UPI00227D4373|nr:hypothetical protein [Algoriphagus sp. PAP.12]